MAYYFSTHGCKLFFGGMATFEEPAPLVVAAAARALILKKLDILQSSRDYICLKSKTNVNQLPFQKIQIEVPSRTNSDSEVKSRDRSRLILGLIFLITHNFAIRV